MSQRKNVCFNASMDEELLALLQEQIELGKRGNRGFKQDVYATIATKMNKLNHGVGRITASTIINHCKVLKKNFAQATELLNVSGFGFDVATKRVIAEDDVWTAWLQGHPEAVSWRGKTIDYDKLSLVFGKDIETGQFARPSTYVGSTTPTTSVAGANTQVSGSILVGLNDCFDNIRMNGSEGSSKKRARAKDPKDIDTYVAAVDRNSKRITSAITEVPESIRHPKKRVSMDVVKELDQIADLSDLNVEIAHEWLTIHADMATIFLSAKDKSAWIQRRLPQIRSDSYSVI
ncbi:hypothetical protein MRB53_016066 [Persea americana]|uniref:Uncharacterized protein n=1 Tax=Persea americana TaxID=3435 RepID=A0ACC2M0V7_PERAE|nr:hypothetical protein MRB53_016066 [Persea americana]